MLNALLCVFQTIHLGLAALLFLMRFIIGNEALVPDKGKNEILMHFVNCMFMYAHITFWVHKMCSIRFCNDITLMLNSMIIMKQRERTGKS